MEHKSDNATSASNGATPKAHAVTRRDVGSVWTYMGQRTALRAKEPGV